MPLFIPPGWALGALLASIYASLFQVWRGRTWGDYARFVAASWFGFAIGQWLGAAWGLDWLRIGEVRLFSATVGALGCLLIVLLWRRRTRS